MNPFLIDAKEMRRHHQEILREVKHDRIAEQLAGTRSSVMIRALTGLGGILIAAVTAALWQFG